MNTRKLFLRAAVICLSVLFSICFAGCNDNPAVTSYLPTEISHETAAEYEKYKISIDGDTDINSSDILAMCAETKRYTINNALGDIQAVDYSSDTLSQYLTEFEDFIGICEMNSQVYVSYNTDSGDRVTVAYDSVGWSETTYYYTKDNLIMYFTSDKCVAYVPVEK